MNHGEERKKKINPKQRANVLSTITFFFSFDFLRKGFKQDITENDVYEVLPQFKASKVGDTLEKEFLTQRSQKDRVSSYRLLWSCYGRYYFLLGLVQLTMKMIMITILPKAQGKFISYFSPKTTLSKSDAVYYAVVVIGLNFAICTYNHNYRFLMTELGIKIKTAFCSLIYRKSLKLTTSSLSRNGIGKIVTLISKDVNSFENMVIFLNDMWISLIVLVVASCIMYSKIGVSALIGLLLLVLVVPLQVYLGKLTSDFRIKAAKATDERLQYCQETLSAIKLIKMYKWEDFFCQKILRARKEEMKKIKLFYFARSIFTELGTFIITLTWYILITTYTGLGNQLTAEIAFFLRECLRALRSPMTISIPLGILRSSELVASIRRIDTLLTDKELTKTVQRENKHVKPFIQMTNVAIKVGDCEVLEDVNLKLGVGVNIISGKIGGGKTALLQTIVEGLGYSGLERVGTISYASEEPWLFPSSIKQNILFGQQYNEKRYREVLRVCALDTDLGTFKKGDETIVDDRGRNLSKGQQVRINLARAVYNDSDIYLLDDCLSSLDVYLQEYVFTECVKNFLDNKVVVLVSNNRRFFNRSDNVFVVVDGSVKSVTVAELPETTIDDLMTDDNNVKTDTLESEKSEISETTKLLDQKPYQNIYHEKAKQGKVELGVYKKYLNFAGGLFIMSWVLLLYIATQTGLGYSEKSVSRWVNSQQNLATSPTNTTEYQQLLDNDRKQLNLYTLAIVLSAIFLTTRIFAYYSFAAKAASALHKCMTISVINATMKFFDVRYFGNILNRFAKDMYTIDELLPFNVDECLKFVFNFISAVVLIVSVNVYFLIPIVIFFVVLFFMRFFYIPTGRSIKRLDSATRSPVVGHLNATLEGLSTIRASGTESILKKEFDRHQDLHTSTIYMEQSASRFFAYALDLLCNFFIAVIIIRFLVYDKDTQAGSVGLAISQALSLPGRLQWGIRQWADLESHMTSVERVLEYTNIEKENRSGRLLENVSSFKISYKNVHLEYEKSKGHVLKSINFVIKPGEKVGIVGGTGAGKSSLISILFKLYQYEGSIIVNDIDIKLISLDSLRSNIVVISQDPVVFNGTIRSNIDPTGCYTDDEIWTAIDNANLKHLIPALDCQIVDKGSNFSCGQKQLICLVRALVSKSRIVVLDEATANVDPETDIIISKIIKEGFVGCTVLMVAHKLTTILDFDKVMVIDKGEIVEFDAPDVLVQNENGVFCKMVAKAGLSR